MWAGLAGMKAFGLKMRVVQTERAVASGCCDGPGMAGGGGFQT
jgi:hypothetical protein